MIGCSIYPPRAAALGCRVRVWESGNQSGEYFNVTYYNAEAIASTGWNFDHWEITRRDDIDIGDWSGTRRVTDHNLNRNDVNPYWNGSGINQLYEGWEDWGHGGMYPQYLGIDTYTIIEFRAVFVKSGGDYILCESDGSVTCNHSGYVVYG